MLGDLHKSACDYPTADCRALCMGKLMINLNYRATGVYWTTMVPLINCIETVQGHNDRVWDIKWNPSGNLLASCGTDKAIRIWGKEGMLPLYWKMVCFFFRSGFALFNGLNFIALLFLVASHFYFLLWLYIGAVCC